MKIKDSWLILCYYTSVCLSLRQAITKLINQSPCACIHFRGMRSVRTQICTIIIIYQLFCTCFEWKTTNKKISRVRVHLVSSPGTPLKFDSTTEDPILEPGLSPWRNEQYTGNQVRREGLIGWVTLGAWCRLGGCGYIRYRIHFFID